MNRQGIEKFGIINKLGGKIIWNMNISILVVVTFMQQ